MIFVSGPGDAGWIGAGALGSKRKIQTLFSNPPETYSEKVPSAAGAGAKAMPTLALWGLGK